MLITTATTFKKIVTPGGPTGGSRAAREAYLAPETIVPMPGASGSYTVIQGGTRAASPMSRCVRKSGSAAIAFRSTSSLDYSAAVFFESIFP